MTMSERDLPVETGSVEDLVRRVQSGDGDAFEALYRRTVERTFALCLRMSGNLQHAEELTQDVYVRAWQKLESFRGESRFTTWLHRLAVNLVLQDRRTRGRRANREELTADPGDFGAVAQRAMPGTRVDLERAIDGLPEGAREVLILRDIEGYKYDEIAELKGVALGTVKAQIHRARRLVREALEK